jgi:hypothetical protein
MANALETIAAATAQLFVGKLLDPALRPPVIGVGTQAGRRAAAAALLAHEPPDGFVSPALIDPDEEVLDDDQGFTPVFAIPFRFGQLTPVALEVGALNELDQRYTVTLETPAENAYVYEGQTCEG